MVQRLYRPCDGRCLRFSQRSAFAFADGGQLLFPDAMNLSTLATIGQPLPQIRLPRDQWWIVGRSLAALSMPRQSLDFTFSTAARFWPTIRWSPELAKIRHERREFIHRICRNRLYAEQHGKPLDSFPARIRRIKNENH